MNKKLLFAAGLLVSTGSLSAQTILFEEDFEGGMPSSIILHNVDSLTPASTLASYTQAWQSVDDFSGSNNAAASISWYTPAGQSDDWMVIQGISIANTGTVLSWKSRAQDPSFPDGYQVFINTGGTDPADFLSGTPVFSVAADQTTWGTHSVNLDAYVGDDINIAFRNNSNDMFILFVDDVTVAELEPVSIALTGLNTTRFHETGTNVTISGTVVNEGSNPITSFDLTWTDGTNTYPQTISGLNIPGLGTYNFTHSTVLNVADPSDYNIEVTVSLTGDASTGNDEIAARITGYEDAPDRVIVGEEATGTWCGWCPRGHVFMEYMEETYEDRWIGIAVHNSDPMTITAYDSWMGGYIAGYPSGLIMRNGEYDPSEFEDGYAAELNGFSLATVDVSATMDDDRMVDMEVSSVFSCNTDGSDFSYVVMIVEDGVTGEGSTWSQTNYYSSSSQNLPLEGAGHNWQTSPNPVPFGDMVYNDVARELLTSVTGQAGSVPSTVTAGGEVSYADDFTLSSDYDEANVRIVALLVDNNTGVIYNAGESYLWRTVIDGDDTTYVYHNDTFELVNGEYVPAGVSEMGVKAEMRVFPNPTNGIMNIMASNLADGSSITIYDMSGRVVYTDRLLGLQGGIAQVNLNNIESGLYHVVVSDNESTAKQTISVVR